MDMTVKDGRTKILPRKETVIEFKNIDIDTYFQEFVIGDGSSK